MCRTTSQIWTDAPAKHSLQSVPLQRPSFTLRAGSSGPCQSFFRTGPSLLVFLVTLSSPALAPLGAAFEALLFRFGSALGEAFTLGEALPLGEALALGEAFLPFPPRPFPFPFPFFPFPLPFVSPASRLRESCCLRRRGFS